MLDNLKLPNETIDKAYDDGLHLALSETGNFLGRIPRAINAALSGLDQWILQREYNVASTKKALEGKLSSINPERIVPPEPYVAIPAIQSISYCMSNKELFDLYANLLSKAMVSDTKDDVHPAFVEIIKQMSPNDALILKEISKCNDAVPTATISIVMKLKGLHMLGQTPDERYETSYITDIKCSSLSEKQIRISVNNLERLGIIALNNISLKEHAYDFVKQSEVYLEAHQLFEEMNKSEITADYIRIHEKCFALTSLGELFCDICIKGFE